MDVPCHTFLRVRRRLRKLAAAPCAVAPTRAVRPPGPLRANGARDSIRTDDTTKSARPSLHIQDDRASPESILLTGGISTPLPAIRRFRSFELDAEHSASCVRIDGPFRVRAAPRLGEAAKPRNRSVAASATGGPAPAILIHGFHGTVLDIEILGYPFNRSKLRGWVTLVLARTIRSPWASSRPGSGPMRTA